MMYNRIFFLNKSIKCENEKISVYQTEFRKFHTILYKFINPTYHNGIHFDGKN